MRDIIALLDVIASMQEGDALLDAEIAMRFDMWRLSTDPDKPGWIDLSGAGRTEPPTYSRDAIVAAAWAERVVAGCSWMIAKGRLTPEEPIYGAIVEVDGGPQVIAEHNTSAALAMVAAVLTSIHKKQEAANG